MTAAIGLAATGRFNLISVAFIPLFVGLGVDFSIQFSVRSLAERLIHPSLRAALVAAGSSVGAALALSAAAIGAGFFAFLPTTYVGVAELGAIAGLGMGVAFVLSIALLPALLMLLRPPAGGMAEVGFTMLAPVDAFVRRHRRPVLAAGLAAAMVSCALLPLLRFDFNPLHLKSSKVESMATLQDLAADPDWTPDAINILAPSLAAARGPGTPPRWPAGGLPDRDARQLRSAQQKEKLALIGDAAVQLRPVLAVTPRRASLRRGAAAEPGSDGAGLATGGGRGEPIPPRSRRAASPTRWSICRPPRPTSAPWPRLRWSRRSSSCWIRSARCCRPAR